MRLFRYMEFIKESQFNSYSLPSYEEAVLICNKSNGAFYETKKQVDGFSISLFNYRLAQWKDFNSPGTKEMRGLVFVFNLDGTLFKRYVLLEKFFNLNQVPDTMYSVVKNYKIKFISNKEDGSIASFIKLPNGKVIGRSKMGFDNDQSNGINKVYKTNKDIKSFVDWCLFNDIIPIFEYVSSSNRIVLRYSQEELILLRLRDNKTGKHIDIREHLDKIGSIRIAPFEDEIKDLDNLIELTATRVDKEGSIVTCLDELGRDFFFKIKTPWYLSLHGLNEDLDRENIIIEYIIDDKIDDILGQIPEDDSDSHDKVNKIISIVRNELSLKSDEIEKSYDDYIKSDLSKKDYALQNKNNANFRFVMTMVKADDMRKMTDVQIIDYYKSKEVYQKVLQRCEPYEMSKEWLRDLTKRLQIAREWLQKKDLTLFFKDIEESDDN